ncbi:GAF domain-containing SpoIIE family protein phosphatase [Streptomyces sp. ALI-76-A]|uniref:PP2C family protein-serine/threonine phosphatase n=1 Tax=Streptomyces sp. ALI-76-A TaxID=3025736 RepID=UPI00256EC052|nr:GAF domain-containing SpoIIE family protein phosphatase [Streptomyces sp. ALI-76-A]MDL5205348.1 SpoIIE family protein phosphatase [Streptomyces sp. ALI-76-A]
MAGVPEASPGEPRLRRVPPAEVEAARMEAVRRYDILDTPPDGAFDRVAAMAARLFDVPVASVTIVDADRIWFKAIHGLEGVAEIGRDPGLCGSAILRDDALVIPDTLTDPIACTNPLVTGPLGVRFYAAAPIITADGYRLGTVNILDTKPRLITEADTETLADLAAVVLDAMELRLSGLRLLREEQERRKAEEEARTQAERDTEAITAFATTLQRTLLPPVLPPVPGLELACHYQTASPRDVGGDFYDVFSLGGQRWAFFLGDVCGRGAEAATVTSLTRYTLRAAAQHHDDPTEVLDALNSALLLDPSMGSRFCTCVFGTLQPAPGGGFSVSVATGGHPPAFHIQHGDDGAMVVNGVRPKGGMLVGALEGARFASHTFHLAPGQGLLLYTDGLTEGRLPDGTMLGEEGVAAFLTTRTTPDAGRLIEDTIALIADLPTGPGDDVALLALSVPLAPPTEQTATVSTARTLATPVAGAARADQER